MSTKQAVASSTLKQPKTKLVHPPIAKMVNQAIEDMNEKGGSSVRAIKKYVAANFVVDAEKTAPFIKKYLARAVLNKILVRTKGKGFTGSFKMAPHSVQKKEIAQRHVTASGVGAANENAKITKKTKEPALASGTFKKDTKSAQKTTSAAVGENAKNSRKIKTPTLKVTKPSSAQVSRRSTRISVERRASRISNASLL